MKVAINGFGRIGRMFFRACAGHDEIDIVATNDITDAHTLAHLLKYDSTFGILTYDIKAGDNSITVNGKEIKILAERDPAKLPWEDMGIDVVLESTGLFTKLEDCRKHLQAGAKKVVLSARYKNEDKDAVMINMGINEKDYDPEKHNIISNASCTTNSLTPVMKVLEESFGVEKALMTTVHSYTSDQRLLDAPHEDLRRARSAAVSIIPTTTNAAVAVTQVIPALKGKFDGMAMRVPTVDGAISDIIAILKKNVAVEEVNNAFRKASENEMKGILGYTEEPIVSRDIVGNSHSAVVDGLSTRVMGGTMVKVLSWYDNEWAYSCRLRDLVLWVGRK